MTGTAVGPATSLAFSTLNHCPFLVGDATLGEQVRAAADAGFDALSLDIFSLRAALADGGDAALAGVADAGLPVLDIAATALGADPDGDAAALAEARRLVAATGARHVMLRLDVAPDGAAVDRLGRAAAALAVEGARATVEPSPMGTVRDLAAAGALAGTVDGLGVVLDSWHWSVGSFDLAELDVALLAYLQLTDGVLPASDDLVAQTLHARALPGEGAFDLDGFVSTVAAAGWSGPVCVEVLSATERRRPVADFAADAASAARRVLGGPTAAAGGSASGSRCRG